jgi:hypothetical protein
MTTWLLLLHRSFRGIELSEMGGKISTNTY